MRLAHILVCHSVSPQRMLASVPHDEDAFWYVFLHGSSPEIAEEAHRLCDERGGRLYPFMYNRGLALSWNDAIIDSSRDGCEAFLLLNDDIYFYDGGYSSFKEMIVDAEIGDPAIAMVTVRGMEGRDSLLAGQVHVQSFACGALLARAINRIGFFDENYVPAYFEDSDYFSRMARAGMRVHFDDRVLVEHERSSTSRALSADEATLLQAAFERNREYTVRKWGGENQGVFAHPFNDPGYNFHIPQERRHAPYGGHDLPLSIRAAGTGASSA